MRIAFLFPLALLAACGSQKPADDTLGTLDGDDAAQQGTVSASAGALRLHRLLAGRRSMPRGEA